MFDRLCVRPNRTELECLIFGREYDFSRTHGHFMRPAVPDDWKLPAVRRKARRVLWVDRHRRGADRNHARILLSRPGLPVWLGYRWSCDQDRRRLYHELWRRFR